jgi:hypothetical protein
MIKGGYILQPRKIDESDISKSPPHIREIWMYLLRKANHQDCPSLKLKRGQLFTSYKQIIKDLSWNVGYRKESYKKHHCETAMKTLTKHAMILTTKTTRGLIITICNYDYYQNPKNYDTYKTQTTKTTMKITRQPHYIQECKNEKNEKNNILLSQLSVADFKDQKHKEYFEIAISFHKLFLKNMDELGISNTILNKATEKWVNHVRYIIEIDKRTKNELREIFMFLQHDIFWKENIRSISKLREKFEDLLVKSRSNGKNRQNSKKGATIEGIAKSVYKYFGDKQENSL